MHAAASKCRGNLRVANRPTTCPGVRGRTTRTIVPNAATAANGGAASSDAGEADVGVVGVGLQVARVSLICFLLTVLPCQLVDGQVGVGALSSFVLYFNHFARGCVRRTVSPANRRGVLSNLGLTIVVLIAAAAHLAACFEGYPQPYSVERAGVVVQAGKWVLTVMGFTLMAAGCIVQWASVELLGRAFYGDAPPTALVTDGPYLLVRHPAALATVTLLVGFCLSRGGYVTAGALGLVTLLYYRFFAGREERALAEAFPGKYDAYKKDTPRGL
ncbi:unnamed protein product [Pedinophyceae sp. YPF-701]|nr:unnamed protein product [Pedinophyceae sp. YPF-701]